MADAQPIPTRVAADAASPRYNGDMSESSARQTEITLFPTQNACGDPVMTMATASASPLAGHSIHANESLIVIEGLRQAHNGALASAKELAALQCLLPVSVRYTQQAAQHLATIYGALLHATPQIAAPLTSSLQDALRSIEAAPCRGMSGRFPGTLEWRIIHTPLVVIYSVEIGDTDQTTVIGCCFCAGQCF